MGTSDSHEQALAAYYEEFRALYGLVEFRMLALDRQAPVTAAAFAGAVASLQAVPAEGQFILFVGVPPALVWLTRTTVQHARSFDDVLRRIEEIDGAVNRLLGREVLRFQSKHPSRHRHVGRRTGHESALAVFDTVQLVLAALAVQSTAGFAAVGRWQLAYLCFLTAVSLVTSRPVMRLRRYTYVPSGDDVEPTGAAMRP